MATTTRQTIKFLCSYGGNILLRRSDRRLRYVGGFTRVLSVKLSVTFSELMKKLEDLCGYSVILRCQLPSEDLDVLVTVKSDEELTNLFEVYDQASLMVGKELKIRAILYSSKLAASSSMISSPSSSSLSSSASSSSHGIIPPVTVTSRRLPARKSRYEGDCYCWRCKCCVGDGATSWHPSYYSWRYIQI